MAPYDEYSKVLEVARVKGLGEELAGYWRQSVQPLQLRNQVGSSVPADSEPALHRRDTNVARGQDFSGSLELGFGQGDFARARVNERQHSCEQSELCQLGCPRQNRLRLVSTV